MNFSNKGEISWYTFAKEIAKSVDKDYLIDPCTTSQYPTKAIRPAHSAMDLSIAKEYAKQINYEILGWRESLHKVLNYEVS